MVDTQRLHTDFEEFLSLVDNEADIRLVVLVGAGYLETHIEALLTTRFPKITDHLRKRLFGRALQGATARYDLAQALGAIEAGVADDLRLLAEIRNKFAHNISVKSCDHPDVAPKADRLFAWTAATAAPGSPASTNYSTASRDARVKLALHAAAKTLYDVLRRAS